MQARRVRDPPERRRISAQAAARNINYRGATSGLVLCELLNGNGLIVEDRIIIAHEAPQIAK